MSYAPAADAHLPSRYRNPQPLKEAFARRIEPALAPGVSILDVGAGRTPAVPFPARPAGCRYVGLDLSRPELEAAPPGSYDEICVGDASVRLPQLEGRFDLVLSYHALEHVRPLARTLDNLHAYLRPGARMVSLLAGTFAAFALVNRVVPERAGVLLMQRLLGRDPETVFDAHYDRCWDGALRRLLRSWASVEIEPFYLGARYFAFSPPLQRLYVRYEDWALSHGHRNLATHYLIDAVNDDGDRPRASSSTRRDGDV